MIHLIAQSTSHSVRCICNSLQVPRSSYYHAAAPTQSRRSDAQMSQAISAIFNHHRRRYGYRRIWKQLSDDGITCAPDRVRRLMQQQGLIAIQPKTYVPQTSDGRADLPSPYLLLDTPLPSQPNEVWAGDITFIPCGEKWLYLAVVIDLCSRRIVGWALADHLRSDLVVDAMKQAVLSATAAGAPKLDGFDASCFDGVYVTGDVSLSDIVRLNEKRVGQEEGAEDNSRLALPNPSE